MSSKIVEYRPPRIALTLVVIAFIAHSLLSVQPASFAASNLVAAFLALSGFAIMMIAWWQFKASRVAICPTHPTDKLITVGIYRLTRNPMYLGIIAMLSGLAVWIGTAPFYAAAIIFFLIIQKFFCPYEENKLRRKFGAEYSQYAAEVKRWI